MPLGSVVGGGADVPVVLGGCEWTHHLTGCHVGYRLYQAEILGTKGRLAILPAWPRRPVLVFVYLLPMRKADVEGRALLPPPLPGSFKIQLSGISTQTT